MNALAQSGLLSPDTLPLLLLTAGLLLSMAEALAPGANFIVVGIALIGAGLGGLALTSLGVAGALLTLFMALLTLVFGAAAFYAYHEFDFYGGKGQQQTSDSDSLKGKTGTVTERVTPTGGEVKLAGGGFNPHYSARSMEGTIDEGEEVMVVDPGGGNVVTVESMGYVEDDIDRELAADRARKAAASEAEREADAAEEDADPEAELERE
ncbi:Membrane protein implicated in regulation of membrane protease activity [Halorubrum ezzemoulense]|uniref:Membrane protein implicated in regulation of membrane protease activity n=2 Tax=Halorubrum ezzemoulense TaxID=337243 RepID=A0A238V659_HALEZ|nr:MULTISPECIES: NfeD family protein [Halorubrum]MDB2236431.1 NfeD family protein [Halorubrum ezzemoulense]MDB2248281.1 NfeD family protein [Halorubrum ezzemoulense]MDB2259560.1 NfeD family protein [Halorubrum ezzemoulense]MDB2266379.1 NfeD family protein [Halorubrum ezzemoulense]OSP04833.1 protease [Halorubrum ezzemoulense DSM 17463]